MDSATAMQQAAEMIRKADRVVALTGAGISVDSGIPHFRSAGGLWDKFDPMEYATIDAFRHAPQKVWDMVKDLHAVVADAKPNAGHEALARLEKAGKLSAIITQNIDNLHQEAGNTCVIEFHGNGERLVCLDCGSSYSAAEMEGGEFPPRCRCAKQSILKPDVVLFGEMIPEQALVRSHKEAAACDLMLVVGTSAVVAPASHMPVIAKKSGARIIEINLEHTPLTGGVTDLFLEGSSTEILPRIAELAGA